MAIASSETIREGIEISREALLGFCCRLARTRRPNRSQVGSGQNIRVESLSRRGLRGPVADRGPNWQLGSCPGHGSSVYPDVSGPAERLALLVVQSLQTEPPLGRVSGVAAPGRNVSQGKRVSLLYGVL